MCGIGVGNFEGYVETIASWRLLRHEFILLERRRSLKFSVDIIARRRLHRDSRWNRGHVSDNLCDFFILE